MGSTSGRHHLRAAAAIVDPTHYRLVHVGAISNGRVIAGLSCSWKKGSEMTETVHTEMVCFKYWRKQPDLVPFLRNESRL